MFWAGRARPAFQRPSGRPQVSNKRQRSSWGKEGRWHWLYPGRHKKAPDPQSIDSSHQATQSGLDGHDPGSALYIGRNLPACRAPSAGPNDDCGNKILPNFSSDQWTRARQYSTSMCSNWHSASKHSSFRMLPWMYRPPISLFSRL